MTSDLFFILMTTVNVFFILKTTVKVYSRLKLFSVKLIVAVMFAVLSFGQVQSRKNVTFTVVSFGHLYSVIFTSLILYYSLKQGINFFFQI